MYAMSVCIYESLSQAQLIFTSFVKRTHLFLIDSTFSHPRYRHIQWTIHVQMVVLWRKPGEMCDKNIPFFWSGCVVFLHHVLYHGMVSLLSLYLYLDKP